MVKQEIIWFTLTSLLLLFSSSAVETQSKVTKNPADQLVQVINNNRTAHHLTALYSNPGLACIALQYIKAYEGNCDDVGGPKAKKPEDSAFAESFAPNCNVDPATLTQITGRFLGCQSEYINPDRAFSEVLMKDGKSLNILYSKNHTEVGAAASGSDGGGPYFWCVLFSNGKSNSSFVLEGGEAKVSRPGCFSGANDDCSSAQGRFQSQYHLVNCVLGVLAVIGFAFSI
ncbi:hypothetical protein SOVF_122670 [Spinacia oleracea]|uniref:Ferredoxin-like protein n=1 Tax=Spinacia oleracea TaxID=3562 RepID=A0A9R0IUT9_SPIOL|nr:uncharacterized protein LOC110795097 [Spinacia oleracea]KNA12796.1 hypothetical protein SOVF_122670 [Spinacia oleracea]